MNEITEIVIEDQDIRTAKRVFRTFLKTTVVLLVGLGAAMVVKDRMTDKQEEN